MGIREGETKYILERPFKYSNGGQTQEANHILLREPGMEHQRGYYKLTQYITKSQMQAAKMFQEMGGVDSEDLLNNVGEEQTTLIDQADGLENESEETEGMISMSIKMSDIDIIDFMTTFEKMVTKIGAKRPLAIVDSNPTNPLTKVLYEKLHPDEAFGLAVKFCSFFVTAVDIQPKTKSDQELEQDLLQKEV